MASLPTWAVLCVSVGTPLAAFLGATVGAVVNRRGLRDADVWRHREETMRMLRWASEQAASADVSTALMGLAALDALSESELLQPADEALVDAVIDSLIADEEQEYREAGRDAELFSIDFGNDPGSDPGAGPGDSGNGSGDDQED
jgi:hypothetical protein